MTPHFTPAADGWENRRFKHEGISYSISFREYGSLLYPVRGQPGRFYEAPAEWRYWATIKVDASGRPLRFQEEVEDDPDEDEDDDDDEAPIDWPPKPKLSKTYNLELVVLLNTREGIRPDNLVVHHWDGSEDKEEIDLPSAETWANLLLADDETWKNVGIDEDLHVTDAPLERGDAFWHWMIETLLTYIRERKP